MSVKYEVKGKDKDVTFITWLVVLFLLAAAMIALGYAEAPAFPESKAIEVPRDIGAHIGTIALLIILEAAAWSTGRKVVEVVEAPKLS